MARRRDAKMRTRSNVGRVERALAVRVDAARGETLVAAGWTTRVTRGRGEDVILSYASFRLKKDWLTTSVATAAGGMPNSEADGVSDRPIGPDRKVWK